MKININGETSEALNILLPKNPTNVVVNWGVKSPKVNKGDNILNEVLVLDKWKQAQLFKISGVVHPITFKGVVRYSPSIIKSRVWRDVKVVEGCPKISEKYISQPLMGKDTEFRIHIIGSTPVIMSEKVPFEHTDPDMWSMDTCHFIDRKDGKVNDGVKELAVRAVKALGYDFGAVDIMVCGGSPYVLEVNSAPGLNPKHIKTYVKELVKYAGEKYDTI